MPTTLRSRIALFAMMGAFLIPISVSSLRGLTHILTCRSQAKTPFTLQIPEQGPPEVISSVRISRGEGEGLCGGLLLDLRARGEAQRRVKMLVFITNHTPDPWEGTVQLNLGGTSFPVGIGKINAGATASDSVDLHLTTGTHEVQGALLIGP
jgi:hypothetical protein